MQQLDVTMTGVGQRLTEAREARGITLEQAERDTRIIRRYIEALEREDFDVFPAEVYARGFLKSYSSYLGLNSADMLALFPRSTAPDHALDARGATGRRTTSRREAPGRGATTRAGARRTSRRATPPPAAERPGLRLAAIVISGLVIAGVIGHFAGTSNLGLPEQAARQAGSGGAATTPSTGQAVQGRMPDLRNTDEAEALRRLTEIGVVPFVIEVPSRTAPAGQVIRQSPDPNAAIGNAIVTIVISRGG